MIFGVESRVSQFRTMSTEAQQREQLERIGQLTARLLHDTRNQLGGIKLYLAFLEKKLAALPDDGRKEIISFRQACNEVVEKMNRNINALSEQSLLVSQLTRPVLISENKVSLSSLVQQIISETSEPAAVRKIQIHFSASEQPAEILGDGLLMAVALRTLMTEMLRLAPDHSAIHCNLTAERTERRLHIACRSGKPVTELDCRNFFDPLTADRPDIRILSLAQAERIIRAHRGQVVIEKVKAETITIRICLPEAASLPSQQKLTGRH
jgi:signal transduction histidine kinase